LIASVVLAACAGVLGLKRRDMARPFEHRRHTTAGINCLECHAGVTKAGEDDPLHLPDQATCVRCHQKPHDTRACDLCHGDPATRGSALMARRHLRFEHRTHLKGLSGQCVPCHTSAGVRDATSLRPAMAACFGCHEHKDQWRVRECGGCHHDLPSEHVRPESHLVHDGDFLREHGIRAAAVKDLCATCHAESFCASCHGVTVPALPWRFSFDTPKLGRLHPAGFLTRHPEEARVQPGICASCHVERFCADCHADRIVASGTGARNPHPPNWVRARGGEHGRAARLDPLSCASCHGGAGEMLCVGCHKVGAPGGNPHPPGYSSTLDKVRDVPCRLCHGT
jgi:hypothetical protein